MIPAVGGRGGIVAGKPRASGDDPMLAGRGEVYTA